jgi:ABC-type nitrate/sulfonate/bicarbonate transport system permease component
MLSLSTDLPWNFGITIAEVVIVTLIGGLLGIACGTFFLWKRMNLPISDVISLASWIPFMVFYALPFDPNDFGSRIFIVGSVTVGLYGFAYLTSLQRVMPGQWTEFIGELGKEITLRALLVSLFTQSLSQVGWIRSFITEPGVKVFLLATAGLLVFVLLMDILLQFDLYKSVTIYGRILKNRLEVHNRNSEWLAVLLVALCPVTLVFVSHWLTEQVRIGDMFQAFSNLLLGVGKTTAMSILPDLFVSMLEIWGGLLVGAGIAFFLSNVLVHQSIYSKITAVLVSITATIPIILPISLPLIGINRIGSVSFSTLLSIGFLTAYPFLRTVLALRAYTLTVKAFMGIKNALPFAFIGMLFGELYGATAGLGFRIVSERASGNYTSAIALSAFVVFCLTLFFLMITFWLAFRKRTE